MAAAGVVLAAGRDLDKLLGLHKPQEVVITSSMLDREIARLEAELGETPGPRST